MLGEPCWHHTAPVPDSAADSESFRHLTGKIQVSLGALCSLVMENNFLKANQNGPGHSVASTPSGCPRETLSPPVHQQLRISQEKD